MDKGDNAWCYLKFRRGRDDRISDPE